MSDTKCCGLIVRLINLIGLTIQHGWMKQVCFCLKKKLFRIVCGLGMEIIKAYFLSVTQEMWTSIRMLVVKEMLPKIALYWLSYVLQYYWRYVEYTSDFKEATGMHYKAFWSHSLDFLNVSEIHETFWKVKIFTWAWWKIVKFLKMNFRCQKVSQIVFKCFLGKQQKFRDAKERGG